MYFIGIFYTSIGLWILHAPYRYQYWRWRWRTYQYEGSRVSYFQYKCIRTCINKFHSSLVNFSSTCLDIGVLLLFGLADIHLDGVCLPNAYISLYHCRKPSIFLTQTCKFFSSFTTWHKLTVVFFSSIFIGEQSFRLY